MYLIPKVAEIRERRLAANLSQHGLSLKAGLGGQAINRIERGETVTVHPLRAREIAKALGLRIFSQVRKERQYERYYIQRTPRLYYPNSGAEIPQSKRQHLCVPNFPHRG